MITPDPPRVRAAQVQTQDRLINPRSPPLVPWDRLAGEEICYLVQDGVLAIIDGNPGLHAALNAHWPGISIRRCTKEPGGEGAGPPA